jgi:two-component system response regulator RpaA
MKTIFTTEDVAEICEVTPRVVSKWFDSGRLRGYRIPFSEDRRIPREHLRRFLVEHGMTEMLSRLDQNESFNQAREE